jgi:hypothetical protein
MNQDDVNDRVCLANRAGDGQREDYNKADEKVSKMDHSGRLQEIETTINEGVEQWEATYTEVRLSRLWSNIVTKKRMRLSHN